MSLKPRPTGPKGDARLPGTMSGINLVAWASLNHTHAIQQCVQPQPLPSKEDLKKLLLHCSGRRTTAETSMERGYWPRVDYLCDKIILRAGGSS